MAFARALTEPDLASVRATPGVTAVAVDADDRTLYLIDLAMTKPTK